LLWRLPVLVLHRVLLLLLLLASEAVMHPARLLLHCCSKPLQQLHLHLARCCC
jgi:hypothetical protein